jgi:hypothetical protein
MTWCVVGSFEGDVNKFQRKTVNKMDQAIRKVSLEILGRVVFKSPVDTGRFRSNWQVSIGSVPSGIVEYAGTETIGERAGSKGPVYESTVAKSKGVANTAKAGDVIYIANNLPYAVRLEEGGYGEGPKTVGGFSRQAPAGMVTLTVQEFAAVVKSIGVEISRQ